MTTKRIQVRGSFEDGSGHLCWENSPEDFAKLKPFVCEECNHNFSTYDDLLESSKEIMRNKREARMKRVVIESPYAGNVAENTAYAKKCMSHSLHLGEALYASHLLYTQEGLLDDLIPEERELGILAGFIWGDAAELAAVYIDRGISGGMQRGIEAAKKRGCGIEIRSLEREITKQDYLDLGLNPRVAV